MYESGKRFQRLRRQVVEREIDGCLSAGGKFSRFLDVGGAEGLFTRYVSKSAELSVNIDISMPKLVRALNYRGTTEQIQGDAAHLPFKSGSFDMVICVDILRLLPSPQQAIKEIFRVATSRIIIQSATSPFAFFKSKFLRRNTFEIRREFAHSPFGGAVWVFPSRAFIGIFGARPSVVIGILTFPFFSHSFSVISRRRPFNRLGEFTTLRINLL
jgi:SAM-dependent methyltransferase